MAMMENFGAFGVWLTIADSVPEIVAVATTAN